MEKVSLTKVDSVLLSNGYSDSSVSLKKLILFKNYEDDTLMPGKYSLKEVGTLALYSINCI